MGEIHLRRRWALGCYFCSDMDLDQVIFFPRTLTSLRCPAFIRHYGKSCYYREMYYYEESYCENPNTYQHA